MKYLTRVLPRHCTDCVIASVATITGKDYNVVLKTLLPNKKKYADYGVYPLAMLIGLKRLGFKSKSIKNANISNLKKHAILVVKVPYPHRVNGWDYHAVVWDAKRKIIIDGSYRPRGAKRYQKIMLKCWEITPD